MARYIDADKMIYEIRHNLWDWSCVDDIRTSLVLKQTITDIENQPSEDVAPVIHAHWTITYESTAGVTDAKCSNCGYESLAYENDVHTDERCNYCPCCGAKMDEAEIIGKRLIDGLINGMGNNVKSVGQQFCNGEE